MTVPTDYGKTKYPPNGHYTANVEENEAGPPCTCRQECDLAGPCKGQCGCEACSEAYGDYLSEDYD